MNSVASGGDAELVSASLEGDREAYGRIVTRYQSLVCSLAYSATGSVTQSEDLAQETFLEAWKNLASLREPQKLRSWLCGIARNRIHDILNAKCPYHLIKEGDGLIQTVSGINDGLVSVRRAEALKTIEAQIAEIGRELDAVKADAGLKTTCLQPLQNLRSQVEREQSLAHIAQAQAEAVNALDTAISRIEAALKAKMPPPAQPGKTEPPAPVVKSRCIIKPADFVNKPYLETSDDVKAFIEDLRQRLEAAIAKNERIQIR